MKIRAGFISNSSSTSWIINIKDYASVYQITRKLIMDASLKTDFFTFYSFSGKVLEETPQAQVRFTHYLTLLDHLIRIGMDPNTNIKFYGESGEDTFVIRRSNYYLVRGSFHLPMKLHGVMSEQQSPEIKKYPSTMTDLEEFFRPWVELYAVQNPRFQRDDIRTWLTTLPHDHDYYYVSVADRPTFKNWIEIIFICR